VDPLYDDPWIRCDDTTLVIRGYYFPLGTPEVIAYRDIQAVTPVALGPWTGSWRIWGTSHPSYWWHLDWSRSGCSSTCWCSGSQLRRIGHCCPVRLSHMTDLEVTLGGVVPRGCA
jgi:hypothetical protein